MWTGREMHGRFNEVHLRQAMKISWRRVIVMVTVALIVTQCFVVWIEVCRSNIIQDIGLQQQYEKETNSHLWIDKKLAIVVPFHEGDKTRAMESLQKWPSRCHPLTTQHVDLVLYQAESETNQVDLITRVAEGPARCFRMATMVSANLLPEENVYPKGASVQFYKIFLDPSVRKHFIEYDALAILEWDMIVAHHTSFERLYKAAFITTEPFWIKGCTLSGIEFLETASLPGQWHILGHLNGNAIYNNTDPAFIEFVNFTLSRWGYTYSYDVALWTTISDFPYSWPLWQRYASRFVATNLISNVGFHDVTAKDVYSALTVDTMFIHGSTKSLGSISNGMRPRIDDDVSLIGCTTACGSHDEIENNLGPSTFCDASTCSNHDYPVGSIFERFGCGAGDPSKFGPACRLCVDKSRELLDGNHEILQQKSSLLTSNAQMTVCKTKMKSDSIACTQECEDNLNTICDSRCGSGWYGDFNCNWRGLGETCRFCFHDVFAARLANKAASTIGAKVVMCTTHESPLLDEDIKNSTQGKPAIAYRYSKEALKRRTRSLLGDSSTREIRQEHSVGLDQSTTEFAPNITLGQLCVFMPGNPELHLIAEVSVSSIHLFMPGVRVVVATNSASFEAYNSTLGQDLGASVITSSHIQFAEVEADRACGSETRFILYMTPGEILSRSFTSKDTHSPTGDLLVMYRDIEDVSQAHFQRTLASALLLGFHPPSFTYGTDLILPVEANEHLRAKLVSMGPPQNLQGTESRGEIPHVQIIQSIHQLIPTEQKRDVSIHIPELLAAVAFFNNLDGVRFVNMRHWNHMHLFRETSIWDVPLIKPRFSCTINTPLRLEKYQIAEELRKWVAAFTRGASCEQGFINQTPRP